MSEEGRSRMAVHTSPIRVAIVDEERMFMGALGEWLSGSVDDASLVAAVTSWDDLFSHPNAPVDLVIGCIDCGKPALLGGHVRTLTHLGSTVLLTGSRPIPGLIREALGNGAQGFVAKTEPLDALLAAIRTVSAGRSYLSGAVAELLNSFINPKLSAQERRVMQRYVTGSTVREVSVELNISEETAKSYLKRIREKYRAVGIDVGTKVALRRQAVSEGLVEHGA